MRCTILNFKNLILKVVVKQTVILYPPFWMLEIWFYIGKKWPRLYFRTDFQVGSKAFRCLIGEFSKFFSTEAAMFHPSCWVLQIWLQIHNQQPRKLFKSDFWEKKFTVDCNIKNYEYSNRYGDFASIVGLFW